jgi:hypothetical protein
MLYILVATGIDGPVAVARLLIFVIGELLYVFRRGDATGHRE